MEEHNIPDEVFRKSNEGAIVLLFQQNLQKGILNKESRLFCEWKMEKAVNQVN
jgi:hypothetical protein